MTHKAIRAYWKSLDWSKQNCVLADEIGRSETLLCHWRKALGKPQPKNKSHHRFDKRWKMSKVPIKVAQGANWAKLRDYQLVAMWDISRQRVWQLRRTYGKPFVG